MSSFTIELFLFLTIALTTVVGAGFVTHTCVRFETGTQLIFRIKHPLMRPFDPNTLLLAHTLVSQDATLASAAVTPVRVYIMSKLLFSVPNATVFSPVGTCLFLNSTTVSSFDDVSTNNTAEAHAFVQLNRNITGQGED